MKNSLPTNGRSVYAFPSRFGSHASMVNAEKTAELNDSTRCVIDDEYGQYTTLKNRLDTGMADPNRYATSRLDKLAEKVDKE